MQPDKPVAFIVGMGPGTGAALARRFTREGHAVAMISRHADKLAAYERDIPGTRGFVWDVNDADAAPAVFERIRREMGPVATLIYNPTQRTFASGFEASTLDDLDRAWSVNARGLFVAAKQAIPDMLAAGRGCILVSGATASQRGMPVAVTFAPAKAAARMIAQALAREYGPKGIHVAHIVIDGVIDNPRTRQRIPDKPESFFMKPDDIADAYWMLAKQPRSAWSFEVNLRPDGERW